MAQRLAERFADKLPHIQTNLRSGHAWLRNCMQVTLGISPRRINTGVSLACKRSPDAYGGTRCTTNRASKKTCGNPCGNSGRRRLACQGGTPSTPARSPCCCTEPPSRKLTPRLATASVRCAGSDSTIGGATSFASCANLSDSSLPHAGFPRPRSTLASRASWRLQLRRNF